MQHLTNWIPELTTAPIAVCGTLLLVWRGSSIVGFVTGRSRLAAADSETTRALAPSPTSADADQRPRLSASLAFIADFVNGIEDEAKRVKWSEDLRSLSELPVYVPEKKKVEGGGSRVESQK